MYSYAEWYCLIVISANFECESVDRSFRRSWFYFSVHYPIRRHLPTAVFHVWRESYTLYYYYARHSGSGIWTTEKHNHTLRMDVRCYCLFCVLCFASSMYLTVGTVCAARCRWLYRRRNRRRRYRIFDFFLVYWSSAGNSCDAHNTFYRCNLHKYF